MASLIADAFAAINTSTLKALKASVTDIVPSAEDLVFHDQKFKIVGEMINHTEN
jgi:hypothetical protein